MNIMVFDVPAERGGALSILKDFYNEVLEGKDKNINWFFVLSTPQLDEYHNIKILRFPWVKRSWGHRLYFDQIIAPKLVKKYNIDKIFSLQNITIPHVNQNQILYVHQSLPFVDYRFSIKESKLLWMYQNVIGHNIINSIKKADQVIVQTQWMKEACIEKTQIYSEKVKVIPPTISIETKNYFEPSRKALSTFFYPADGALYKNHEVIINACRQLKSLMNINYKVIFTLSGSENKHINSLYKMVQKEQLPIYFEGSKTREEVFKLYTESILLFPSYIETFGMPIFEARIHKGIIIAADTPFAREILQGYENAKFFSAFNAKDLSSLMYSYIQEKEHYTVSCKIQDKINKKNQLIKILTS